MIDRADIAVHTYVYDGEDIAFEITTSSGGTVTTHYVHGPGIDEPLAMVRGGAVYHYHADGLGSVVALTDGAQSVVQQYGYSSFGATTAAGALEQPFGFTGREFDPETGLYFYRARYYDPMEGRFISKDPIAIGGNIYTQGADISFLQYVSAVAAPYLYTENNPINWIDPSGLTPEQDWRLDLRDHGGPHFQKGSMRYDADTLRPLPHKGKIPPELSKTAQKTLMKSGAYSEYLKWVKGGRLLGVTGLVLGVTGDVSRCMNAIKNGQSLDEELFNSLIDAGPYIEAGGMIMPNPYYRPGGWK